ncbi:hypothetical protein [Flagellimonas zhangzhouensis]|uniref:Uncharacterized protein n=1 Tax=Flagellimonas zhangzhouensis TaxID=1073328 RepID=A0A1H2T0N5_9FLAO|nr:hypothetical protein [Allomuricauda zhangzhouensis]SDQ82280.1 hypothetical protein SAMN05216294_2734 [Allomuricauda zhangzhouensis]SDW37526.1 hypothetical protein SAMN04487892_1373 [Allomuricauda zhangzhouensis]
MKKSILFLALFSICINVFATETKLMVRAKAKDAKFVGSSIGGAYVIVRNSLNGQILAEGKTTGSTGNTGLIMKSAHERFTLLSDEKTAGFLAVIDIDEPTYVNVEVVSPVNKKNAQVKASTQLWLIPGKDILGDGVVVEIPGFVIDILTPNTHQYIALESVVKTGVKIEANIVMMCGCPIEKEGIWDSNQMEVKALIQKDGKNMGEITLTNPKQNTFDGQLEIKETGYYQITVYAYNATTGNTGVDKINFVVRD